MSDLHEAFFKWPHPEASSVIVTGSFDQWSGSVHLSKNGSVFEGPVRVPWGEKITYKYIVDGRWTTTDDQPTERDPMGNVNNVYTSPSQPTPLPTPEEKPAEGTVTNAIFGIVQTVQDAAVAMVENIAPGTTGEVTPAVETPAVDTPAPADASAPEAEAVAPTATEPSPTVAPEVAAEEITAEAVLPSDAEPVAPIVPITIVPLEPLTNGNSTPSPSPEADASSAKPLDTAPVDDASTVTPAAAEVEAPTDAPAAPASEGIPASTHTPAMNGVASAAAPEAPGTPTSPKTNGTSHAPSSTSAASFKATPTKDKRMRFPSLRGSRRTSSGSASEFGEKGKETPAGRTAGSQRSKRNSIFGKLKDIFHPDSAEVSR